MNVPRVIQWQWAVRDDDVSLEAKGFGLMLATYMNGHSLKAWPSLVTLSQVTGRSRRQVLRYRQELVAAGLLEVRPGGGRGHATLYTGVVKGGAHATVSSRERVAPKSSKSGTHATRTFSKENEHADDAATAGAASSSTKTNASSANSKHPDGTCRYCHGIPLDPPCGECTTALETDAATS
jgi:hypothetical protein